jgi:hypothetical protein
LTFRGALAPGLAYFALVFAAGWVLGPLRVLWLAPQVGPTAAVLLEAPVMVAVMILAARFTVRRFAVPRAPGSRLGMGGVALASLLVAELLGALGVRRLSLADYLADQRSTTGAVFLLLLGLFLVMPALAGRGRAPRGSSTLARGARPHRAGRR